MKSIFQKIFTLLNTKEKIRFYYLVACNTIISILDIASLAMLVLIIAFYTQNNTKYLFFLPPTLLDNHSTSLILLFFIFFSLKSLGGYLVFHAQMRYVYDVAARMSFVNLSDYLNGTYSDYVNIPPATQVRHISDHTIQFAHYVLTGVYQIITELILVLFAITCILFFDAKLFFILFLLLLPPVIITGYFTKQMLKHARTHVKETAAEALQYLHESLNGYIEANIYHKKDFFISRFISKQRKVSRYLSDVHIAHGIPIRLIEVFAILGLLILIIVNKVWGNANSTELINIGAFMAVAYKLIPGIVKISNITAQLKTYEYIVNDMQHASPAKKNVQAGSIKEIAFKNVRFSYSTNARNLHVDFKIKKGQMVGISGNSGNGKTTIINLLLGFLNPISGNIEVNGAITTSDERLAYHADIAYVKQQTFLIHDTVRKNITLNNTESADERINEILNAVGLNSFLDENKEGINTIITDNGKNISGGQRQRIAIARALYKNAGVIILDEPFNELDNISEENLLKYFKALAATGKTILLITHNKNSLSYCDNIIQLDEA